MDNYCDTNEFEKFPYAELTEKIPRRQLIQSLRNELHLLVTDAAKRKISELGVMEESELSKLVPLILPGIRITYQNNCVWGTLPDSTQNIKLFMADPLSIQVFNKINGHKSIGRMVTELSATSELDASRAFLFVRGLFLTLVVSKVCLPINIPKTG